MPNDVLYYGGNLDGLWRHVKDESVDLVYLDPPLGSNQDYPGAPGLVYLDPPLGRNQDFPGAPGLGLRAARCLFILKQTGLAQQETLPCGSASCFRF